MKKEDSSHEGSEVAEQKQTKPIRPPIIPNVPTVQDFTDVDFKRCQEFFKHCCPWRLPDALGCPVIFPTDRCHHVCFKEDENRTDGKKSSLRDQWRKERAERIMWIPRVLTDPDEIRPDKEFPGRRNYLLTIPADDSKQLPKEHYFAVTEPYEVAKDGTFQTLRFITAYPIGPRDYVKCQQNGPALYKRAKAPK